MNQLLEISPIRVAINKLKRGAKDESIDSIKIMEEFF